MNGTVGTVALIVADLLLIVVLVAILVTVHRQSKKMKELERQMKLFEKAREEKETTDGKKSIL